MKISPTTATWIAIAGLMLAPLSLLWGNGQEKLSVGPNHVLHVRDDGTLYAWGNNENGEVGIGETADPFGFEEQETLYDQPLPVQILLDGLVEDEGWEYVSAGTDHSLAIRQDGSLWAWGANANGQLGDGTLEDRNRPVRVGLASNWVAVSAGDEFSLGLRSDGRLYVWGLNKEGQNVLTRLVAPGSVQRAPLWIPAPPLAAVDAGTNHNLAIGTNGQLYGWGFNGTAALNTLNLGDDFLISDVRVINADTNWAFVEAASINSFAIRTDGTLWGFGSNAGTLNMLQRGTSGNSALARVGLDAGWQTIDVFQNHVVGVRQINGVSEAVGWGLNVQGALGIDYETDGGLIITENAVIPDVTRLIPGLAITDVAAGDQYSLFLDTGGNILGSGNTENGELAIGIIGDTFVDQIAFTALGAPDLLVQEIAFTGEPEPGETVSVSIFIQNAGTGNIPENSGIVSDLRLSSDEVFDGDDVPLTIVAGSLVLNDSIDDGDTASLNVDVRIPGTIEAGTYRFVASLDITEIAGEIEEDNNEGSSTNTLDYKPDIVPAVVNGTIPANGAVGDTFNLQVDITNAGDGALPVNDPDFSFSVDAFLSEDTLGGNEGDVRLLDDVEFSSLPGVPAALASGVTNRLTIPITVPRFAPPGTYRVIFVVDVEDEVAESDPEVASQEGGEDNNSGASTATIAISGGATLASALDNPVDANGPVVFTTDGDLNWFSQSDTVLVGGSAAESPPLIDPDRESVLEAVIAGPATIRFNWRSQTSSDQNFLKFTIDNIEPVEPGQVSRISGSTDWREQTFVLPAATNTVRWTFVQGEESTATNAGFVDNVRIDAVATPDLFVDSVQFEAGTYVPGEDFLNITVLGSNRGAPLPDMSAVDVRAYLSTDRSTEITSSDFFLGSLPLQSFLESNNRFVYAASRVIPDAVEEGDYFVVILIDPDDIIGEDPSQRENNRFVTETASLTVDPRPDLVPQNLTYTPRRLSDQVDSSGLYLVREQFELRFSIANQGLEDIPEGGFDVEVFITNDRSPTAGEEVVLTSFTETKGLVEGGSLTYVETVEIPENVIVGQLTSVGVRVDGPGIVAESDETNNRLLGAEANLIFADETLREAGEIQPGITIVNQPTGRTAFDDADRPWFGQEDTTFDGEDALQSVETEPLQEAVFELTVSNPDPSVAAIVEFQWRVSSEPAVETGDNQKAGDVLAFYIDDALQTFIFGEFDWTQERFELPPHEPGEPHVLRWAYEKDGSIREGEDAGFVDQIEISSIDLAVDLETPAFDNASREVSGTVTVTNVGQTIVPANSGYSIEFLLTPDTILEASDNPSRNDVSLGFIDPAQAPAFNQALAPGEEATATATFTVAPDVSLEDGFLAARLINGGDIPEFNPGNDIAFAAFTVDIPRSLPDFTVDNVSVSPTGNVAPGDTVDVAFDLSNTGSDVDFGTLTGRVSLSTDQFAGDSVDFILADNVDLPELASGASQTITLSDIAIPDLAPEGAFFIIVELDVAGAINENDETNNDASSSPDTVTVVRSISLAEGVIDSVLPQSLTFATSGDGTWVGSTLANTVEGEVGVAPPLASGQSASFSTTIQGPVVLSFAWSIDSQSSFNTLSYTVNGETPLDDDPDGVPEPSQISGRADRRTVDILLSADTNVVQWTLTRNSTRTQGPLAYVDDLQITPVTQPDFTIFTAEIQNLDDNPDGFVLTEPMDIIAIVENQGASVALPDNFRVQAFLSVDEDLGDNNDYELGFLERSGTDQQDDRTIFNLVTPIPASVPEGTYNLIITADATDAVAEFNEINNDFSVLGLDVISLPDLQPLNLSIIQPRFENSNDSEAFFLPGERIRGSFQVRNNGTGPGTGFTISLHASEDRVFDVNADPVFAEITETRTVPPGFTQEYNLDLDVTIPDDLVRGQIQNIFVSIDRNDEILEVREDNNEAFGNVGDEPNAIFSDITLAEALDRGPLDSLVTIINQPTESNVLPDADAPFFGQRDFSFDGEDAARSVAIGDNARAAFTLNIDNPDPSKPARLNFFWLSSAGEGDGLTAFLDEGQVATLFGESDDWVRESVPLPVQDDGEPHRLRFVYSKDAEGSSGDDAGFIDRVTIESFDLLVEEVSLDTPIPAGGFFAGDELTVSVTVANNGAQTIPADSNYGLRLLLSPDGDLTDFETAESNEFVLGTILPTEFAGAALDEELPSDGTVTVTKTFTIPANFDREESFFLFAQVDFAEAFLEAVENNNDGAFENKFSITPLLPDAEGQITGIPADPVNPGQQIDIEVRFLNAGDISIPAGDLSLNLTLSLDDDDTDPSDIELASGLVLNQALNAGGFVDQTFQVTVPIFTPNNAYTVVGRLDPADTVQEEDESNNVFASAGDLDVDSITLAAALDNPEIDGTPVAFTSGGDAFYFGNEIGGDASSGGDGNGVLDAAVTGNQMEIGETSFIETTVPGPARVQFSWFADSGSASNILRFTVNGTTPVIGRDGDDDEPTIFLSDFQTVDFILPAETNVLRWTYTKGAASGANNLVWVDNVSFTPVTLPDLVITSVEFPEQVYVPTLDKIDIELIGSNQGVTTQLPSALVTRAFLSPDNVAGDDDDILIGDLERVEDIGPNNRFVYRAVRDVPLTAPAGDFFLIVVVDFDEITGDGIIGQIEEEIETNNTFVSATASVTIEPRSDLRPRNLTYSAKDTTDANDSEGMFLPGERLNLSFEVRNEGLAFVPEGGFAIDVLSSRDRIFEVGSDPSLLSITDPDGIPPGLGQTYQVTIEIPDDAPFGSYQSLAVIADSLGVVPESSETNNAVGSTNNDIFFTETTLEAAGDLDILPDSVGYTITNQPTGIPQLGDANAPFYGQTGISFDTEDAIRSAAIPDFGLAAFEIEVQNPNPNEDAVLTFYWKVSSEDNDVDVGDVFAFFINGELQNSIQGEVDWTRQTFILPGDAETNGVSTLRWIYLKDEETAVGEDAGFVDQISISSPDLTFGQVDVEIDGTSVNAGTGDILGGTPLEITATIQNAGATAVPANANYDVVVSLTPQVLAGGGALNAIELGRFSPQDFLALAQRIEPGAQVTVSDTFTIPSTFTASGIYEVSFALDTEDNVIESNEDNNGETYVEELSLVSNLPELSLQITNVTPTAALVPGTDVVDVTFAVDNNGLVGIPANTADVRLSLSLDRIEGDNSDIALGTFTIAEALPAMSSTPVTISAVDLPLFTPAENYFVFAEIDPDGDILESNEGNNIDDGDTAFLLEITGVSLEDALDNPLVDETGDGQPNTPVDFISGGDGFFFGRNLDLGGGNIEDVAFTPPLEVGQSGFFEATVPGPAVISFDWSINSTNANNALTFRVNGALPDEGDPEIFGDETVNGAQFILPGGTNRIRWTYTRGAEGVGQEDGYVNNVQFTPIDLPDLKVDEGNSLFETGAFVPASDEIDIVVQGINQGALVDLPTDFVVSAYLSRDDSFSAQDDILLGDLSRFVDPFEPADRFAYLAAVDIPPSTPAGQYFLIVVVDRTDVVTEFNETNNLLISGAASIIIEPRADLVPVSLSINPFFPDASDVFPGFFLNEEVLEISVVIENQGQIDLSDTVPYDIALVLSTDREFVIGEDFELIRIPGGALPLNIPVTYRIRKEIDDLVPVGRFFNVGVILDPDNTTPEVHETNNIIGSEERNLFFAEVSIEEATDADASFTFRNQPFRPAPNDSVRFDAPFFGQTTVSFDQSDAAASGQLGEGETAAFEVDLTTPDPDRPTVLSFDWQVGPAELGVLDFYVNDTLTLSTALSVWRRESIIIPAGDNTLRWEYRHFENGTSGPNNVGYVDRIRVSSTDLAITSLTATLPDGSPIPPAGLGGGDSVRLTATIENQGTTTIPTQPAFIIQSRLTSIVGQFDDGNGFVVGESIFGRGLEPGETASVVINGRIPPTFNLAGSYQFGALADSTSLVAELDEDNNDGFTQSAFSIEPNLPDLSATFTQVTSPLPVNPTDTLSFELELSNNGALALDNVDFESQIILSDDVAIGDADDIILSDQARQVGISLASGGSQTITFSLDVPEFTPIGDYFVITRLDFGADIVESDEGDNDVLSATPIVQVGGISIPEALDQPAFTFTTGGDARWFGRAVGSATDTDAAQNPPLEEGETAFIETEIDGPAQVSFRWRAQTGSLDNFLNFTLDGLEPEGIGRVAGQQDFVTVTFVAPAERNNIRWTYTQGDGDTLGDIVNLDDLQVTPITQPDLIIDSVTFEEGTYVPQQNNIDVTLLARNQGLPADVADADNLSAEAYLSADNIFGNGDDILLGTLERFQEPINVNDRFGFAASFPIGADVAAGDYFVIAVVDPVIDPFADDSAAPADFGVVDELEDRGNNVFVSSTASVFVQPRPDLVPTALEINDNDRNPDEPGFFVTGDDLEVSFQIQNTGLADAPAVPFEITLVLSTDRVFDTLTDFTLLTFEESRGIPVNTDGQGNLIPGVRNYLFSIDIPDGAPLGEFQFVGLIIDEGGVITESNENNNARGVATTPDAQADLIISELPLAVATGDANRNVTSGRGDDLPFFAQTSVFFDAADGNALQSPAMDDGQTAAFSLEINTPQDSADVISFAWRVSSERALITDAGQEQVKEDALRFLIDGVQVASISGEVDWGIRSFTLSPGQRHQVRWEYVKDEDISNFEDAGWVDRIITESPNMTFLAQDAGAVSNRGLVLETSVPVDGFSRNAPIDYTLRMRNNGTSVVRSSPATRVQLRISPDPIWDEDGATVRNDFTIDTFTISETAPGVAFNLGQIREFNRTANIPENIAVEANYYLIARVDFEGLVAESDEADNEVISNGAIVAISPDISLTEAIDQQSQFEWETGGDSTWFGYTAVEDFLLTSDGEDAVRSSQIEAGEETFVSTEVTGPALIDFSWRVSSVPNLNYLAFAISDVEQTRISGEVPWGFSSGTFALAFDGEITAPIAYDATPAEVQAALNAVPAISAAGGVTVSAGMPPAVGASATAPETTPRYIVSFNNLGARDLIEVDGGNLDRRADAAVNETMVGDPGTASVQAIEIAAREQFFIPAGAQTVSWTYVKNSATSSPSIEDTGYVDDVAITPVTLPDLIVKNLQVEEGSYVLDRGDAPDQDRLPVTVIIENRGAELPGGIQMAPSDISVRLSADKVFGNDDDILLANVQRVDLTESSNQVVFSGDFVLPLNTPDGEYFVAAYVDFFERFEEFRADDFVRYTSTDNNLAITANRLVEIQRLPDLVIEDVDFDSTKIHFPADALSVDFTLRNRGLGDVLGNQVFDIRVRLFGILFDSVVTEEGRLINDAIVAEDLLGTATFIRDLTVNESNILINRFLPGVSDLRPEGSNLRFKTELVLPPRTFINDALGAATGLDLVVFFLVFDVDQGTIVAESDERNTFILFEFFPLNINPDTAFANGDSFEDWATRYGLAINDTGGDSDADNLTNLQEYASHKNPFFAEDVAGGLFSDFGFTNVEETEYLAITFDINRFAADLEYVVEVSTDMQTWTPIQNITPPYNTTHGSGSLTGVGGLIEEAEVISATERGYAGRLTVRDIVEAGAGGPRFMRLRVVKE